MKTSIVGALALALALALPLGCDRGDPELRQEEAEVQIDEDLGTLQVTNNVEEPVAVHLDGQEIYTVPPGRSYTFRNLPTGKATIYGVGRISQKHFGLPELEIEEGGSYEWTINP